MARPLLLGHRGLRLPGAPPENTIAAFDRALQSGCDGFEFDVRRTADGGAVICHDPRFQGIEVANAPHAAVTELMSLGQVIARYSGQAFLDIELKVGGLEEITLTEISQNRPRKGFVVSSFFASILRTLRSSDNELPLGFICDRPSSLIHWRELPVQCVIAHFSLLQRGQVSEIQGEGKKVIAWTVNNQASMLRLQEWGIDGIISDDPELLVRTVG